jgi:hypothetical protein
VSNTKRVTRTYNLEEEGGGGGASGRGRARSANTSWGSESVSDPGSAVEAGAGTDSARGCAAGSAGVEVIMDTAIVKGKCAFGPFLSILVIECKHKCLNVKICPRMNKVQITSQGMFLSLSTLVCVLIFLSKC